MDVLQLVTEFIRHSPRFYDDSDLSDIDKKHSGIISSAYQEVDKLDLRNFRNWSAQTDLGGPSEFSARQGLLRGIVRPLYKKIFHRRQESLLLQSLLDDIHIIRSIEGDSLLRENPVHLSPGVGDYYTIGNTTVNFRWLRYIYLTKQILNLNLLREGGTWVDVGSYYGGLQGLVRKYNPKARMVLVDFHHQLCRSYIYLSSLFPDAIHIFPDMLNNFDSYEGAPEGSITYLPARMFEEMSSRKVDLATNFFSFGEMSRNVTQKYLTSETFSRAKKLYLVNRFVSAPFFDRTYDTDLNVLDYLIADRNIDYFDVFPIHHFLSTKRELFGRKAPRNFSSSNFEYISSNKEYV